MIADLDAQVEILQQTLTSVQSGSQSQQGAATAQSKLAAARAALANAHAETKAENRRLREIEHKLLAQQDASHEVKEAEGRVREARLGVDRELPPRAGVAAPRDSAHSQGLQPRGRRSDATPTGETSRR